MTWWPPRGRAADTILAVGVGLPVLAFAVYSADQQDAYAYLWPAAALITAATAALCLRRAYPLAVALATLVLVGVYYPATGLNGPAIVLFMLALYTLAAERGVLPAAVLTVLPVAAFVIANARAHEAYLPDVAAFMMAGWLAATAAIGGVVHNRRAYLAEAAERTRAAERVREEESRLRATDERLRIARDLHDVVGHHLSLINVQAAAAVHRADPEQALEAVAAIKDASREALRELRATLGLLRQADEDAPVSPTPGLSDLPELLERGRGAGLRIAAEEPAVPIPEVPAGTGLAAYRIVQEALTNVTKHAPDASVRVAVAVSAEGAGAGAALVVEVADDGGYAGTAPVAAPEEVRPFSRARPGPTPTGGRPPRKPVNPTPGVQVKIAENRPVDNWSVVDNSGEAASGPEHATERGEGPGATERGEGPSATERVRQPGPAPAGHAQGGHGIQSMRERALAVGGTVTAAPRPEGGFTVRAVLPLPTTQPPAPPDATTPPAPPPPPSTPPPEQEPPA